MGGLQPIPMTDLLAYMQIYEPDDEDVFVQMIIAIDTAFMKLVRAKQDAASSTKEAKNA